MQLLRPRCTSNLNQLNSSFFTFVPNSIGLSFSVYLDFEDNSRDWALLLNSSSGWKLSHGCTETAGTGPCDDVSGGGLRHSLFLFRSLVRYYLSNNHAVSLGPPSAIEIERNK